LIVNGQASSDPDDLQDAQVDTLRLAAIVDSSDDAIVSKDLDGIITSWNRAAERMFGFTAEEVVGKSIRLIVPRDRQDEEDRVLARIRQGLLVDHFETIRQRKDGSLIPISLSVSPIRDGRGRVIGASKIARDISDRKEAERLAERSNRESTFLSQISAALSRSLNYEETLRTVARSAVPAIADWCAVDVADAEGELKRVASAPGDPADVLATEIAQRYGGDPESPHHPEYVMRTGKPALVPTYLCVPMIAHRRPLGVISMVMGESNRRYVHEDLLFAELVASRAALAVENALSYEQLQAANRLKDEFLATLSHELRTPLNAVLGYARMLRIGAVKTDKMQHALDVIERNATSLTQIVEDVLDVSRIVSGKVRLQMRPVSAAKVVSDAVATVQPAADAKGVRIECAFDSNVEPVSGDPDRLQQVLWNLVSNAVKFTSSGGRVQVQVTPERSNVSIVIRDTGIGIPSAFLPHIFERFRQAESGTTRSQSGLGLGLAIARHIVEMHGGTIEAASEGSGRGAIFTVRLPILAAQPAGQSQNRPVPPPADQRSAGAPLADLSDVRVLVVDDDADALAMVREMLETAGATVDTATSGDEALESLARNRPDVMISDVGMPLMDGFDLMRHIRTSKDSAIRNIPAAALTAYARSEDRSKSLRAGFGMHISKPVDPAELLAVVSSLARNSPPASSLIQ
jgi:PAS domain S-box-containing protein